MRRRVEPFVFLVCTGQVSARSVEEWQLSNARTVRGGVWRVAEVELFSDTDCKKQLTVSSASTFSTHPLTEQVVLPRTVENSGQDCVDACDGKPGYCAWCGKDNACCRKGFKADPPECQRAQGFTTSVHECVAVPGERLQTNSGVYRALDGKRDTAHEATCQDGCGKGTVSMGGTFEERGQIRCIVAYQRRDDAQFGGALQASLWRRPMLPAGTTCPGACRSGQYLEKSKEGVCNQYLSPHGKCGSTPEFSTDGVDCRGCAELTLATQHSTLAVVSRKLHDEGQVMATTLKATGVLWAQVPKPGPVEHVGEDCWTQCMSGFCDWCGTGHACCKSGWEADPPECADATGFVAMSFHECVALSRTGASLADAPLPPWVMAVAFLVPWVILSLAALWYCCRRRGSRTAASPSSKALSGEVYYRSRPCTDKEEEHRRKLLREKAQKLEWIT